MPFIGLGSGIFISPAKGLRIMCIEFPWCAPGCRAPVFRIHGRACAVEGGQSQVARRPLGGTRTGAGLLLGYSPVLWKLQGQESVFLPATGLDSLTVGCCIAIAFKGISFTKKTQESPRSIDNHH